VRTLTGELKSGLFILVGFVGLIWLVELVDLLVFRGALDAAGIRPRDPEALWGIVLAPFLHRGLPHLVANTVPLLVLGWLVLVRRRRDFLLITALVTVVGGLGVWLFARPQTIHLGASGVVFGYLGYLLLRAWFERSLAAVLLALIAGLLYGSALWGVLPGQRGISWEGHLFGFAGGGAAARLFMPRARRIPARRMAPIG
jgi:membrane associated rhomboid family serine protease